ncbi:hypothetical protein U6G28_11295 [Actinomycetaceae bacterium MB13-C1-2]|nr:hypothetical protein U6G28_11295 [Actinomycetaceae bacterium MB13-C1-2]
MDWFEAFGWLGSILVVISLALPNTLAFRTTNLIGSGIATLYNLALGIWPYFVMNAAICIVNVYWLIRILRARQETTTTVETITSTTMK